MKNENQPQELSLEQKINLDKIIAGIKDGSISFYKVITADENGNFGPECKFVLLPVASEYIDGQKIINPRYRYESITTDEFIRLVKDKNNPLHMMKNNPSRDYLVNMLDS